MTRPVLLDLFCNAGGAAKGYADAGFRVVGVDIDPQPFYPYEFTQMDVLKLTPLDLQGYDAIHASPPCQAHSVASNGAQRSRFRPRPDLIPFTRELLNASGKPWVMENVIGAPLEAPIQLCGSSFGLGVRRHRLFEANWNLRGTPCKHYGAKKAMSIAGNFKGTLTQAQEAMGIDWGDRSTITQAVPPAYTRFIGEQLWQLVR